MTTKIAELEAQRAARKAAHDAARDEQTAADLAAIYALEVSLDDELAVLHVPRYRAGLPAAVAVRPPTEPEYRRFVQMIRRAKDNLEARGAAQDMLAEVCWVYPPKEEAETRRKLVEAFPGIIPTMALEVSRLAELRTEREGKD
jgi:hypothetical protein